MITKLILIHIFGYNLLYFGIIITNNAYKHSLTVHNHIKIFVLDVAIFLSFYMFSIVLLIPNGVY